MKIWLKITLGMMWLPELLGLAYLVSIGMMQVETASAIWLYSIMGLGALGVMLWARPKKNINQVPENTT